MSRLYDLVRRVPKWVFGLPAFGAGLAVAAWLGVVPKDVIVYAGMVSCVEMLAAFRRWAVEPDKNKETGDKVTKVVVEEDVVERVDVPDGIVDAEYLVRSSSTSLRRREDS